MRFFSCCIIFLLYLQFPTLVRAVENAPPFSILGIDAQAKRKDIQSSLGKGFVCYEGLTTSLTLMETVGPEPQSLARYSEIIDRINSQIDYLDDDIPNKNLAITTMVCEAPKDSNLADMYLHFSPDEDLLDIRTVFKPGPDYHKSLIDKYGMPEQDQWFGEDAVIQYKGKPVPQTLIIYWDNLEKYDAFLRARRDALDAGKNLELKKLF